VCGAAQAQVVPKWKFSFFQGRHGWTHPSVPMPRRSDHWAFAHHNKSLPLGEFQMQCMTLEHVLRRGNFDPLLADPRPIMLFTSSPDFACPDSATKWGGEELPRIAHFVRDPWSMAVSSFLYHNQKNTPERFVKRLVGPCVCNHRRYVHRAHSLPIYMRLHYPCLSTPVNTYVLCMTPAVCVRGDGSSSPPPPATRTQRVPKRAYSAPRRASPIALTPPFERRSESLISGRGDSHQRPFTAPSDGYRRGVCAFGVLDGTAGSCMLREMLAWVRVAPRVEALSVTLGWRFAATSS
jgi:hypothetical protein